MEIKIGKTKESARMYSVYYWIDNQGFTLRGNYQKGLADWTLNNLEAAFLKIPGVTVKRIEGTGFYGGIDK